MAAKKDRLIAELRLRVEGLQAGHEALRGELAALRASVEGLLSCIQGALQPDMGACVERHFMQVVGTAAQEVQNEFFSVVTTGTDEQNAQCEADRGDQDVVVGRSSLVACKELNGHQEDTEGHVGGFYYGEGVHCSTQTPVEQKVDLHEELGCLEAELSEMIGRLGRPVPILCAPVQRMPWASRKASGVGATSVCDRPLGGACVFDSWGHSCLQVNHSAGTPAVCR